MGVTLRTAPLISLLTVLSGLNQIPGALTTVAYEGALKLSVRFRCT